MTTIEIKALPDCGGGASNVFTDLITGAKVKIFEWQVCWKTPRQKAMEALRRIKQANDRIKARN
jgi:hypothetical protein